MTNYIILAAGVGSRLAPLTQDCPKSLHLVDPKLGITVIERTVNQIHHFDPDSKIYVVAGFQHDKFSFLKKDGVDIIYNPFFMVTNSIASLWFARNQLSGDCPVTIINADVLLSDDLFKEVVCKPVDGATILYDGSVRSDGDYNVQIASGKILVMSKDLREYDGEYVGVTKLSPSSARILSDRIEKMVSMGQYDQWYENALVQLIFEEGFDLLCEDVSSYRWVEIDDVNDLIIAKKVIQS